jgi:hypothetical protein
MMSGFSKNSINVIRFPSWVGKLLWTCAARQSQEGLRGSVNFVLADNRAINSSHVI